MNLSLSPLRVITRQLGYSRYLNTRTHRLPWIKSKRMSEVSYTGVDSPLVWVDCEMSGLDPRKNRLLEVAVIITDGNLQKVDEGIEYVIRTDKEHLDTMDEWCTNQHAKSGLTKACIESPYELEAVKQKVAAYILKHIPERRVGILAGNSVHVDKLFLAEYMPEIISWLHYRIVDVSSIKELVRRWFPDSYQFPKVEGKESEHRALADINHSIRELKWYREKVFREPILISMESGNSSSS